MQFILGFFTIVYSHLIYVENKCLPENCVLQVVLKMSILFKCIDHLTHKQSKLKWYHCNTLANYVCSNCLSSLHTILMEG